MLGYNDEIEDYPYDPARAKELLAEASYPDGLKLPICYTCFRPMFDPPKIGKLYKAIWQRWELKLISIR